MDFEKMNESNIDEYLNIFKDYIGLKAQLPYIHSTTDGKEISLNSETFNFSNYDFDICSFDQTYVYDCLTNLNVDLNKYNRFINLISEKVLNDKTFVK